MSSDKPIIALLGGTGKEGPGLALRWATAGYSIIIGSRQLEKAESVAGELNSQLNINTILGMENASAARKADISVLTVQYSAHQQALSGLTEALKGKILVDATARVDFRDPTPPPPPSAARFAQTLLGSEVQVVAAFQNVPAHLLRKNLGGSLDIDVLICADDISAVEPVVRLAEDAGMRAYFAGNLDNAVVVEGITSLLISMNKHYGLKTASIAVTGIQKD